MFDVQKFIKELSIRRNELVQTSCESEDPQARAEFSLMSVLVEVVIDAAQKADVEPE